jgi:hypothetical protein
LCHYGFPGNTNTKSSLIGIQMAGMGGFLRVLDSAKTPKWATLRFSVLNEVYSLKKIPP